MTNINIKQIFKGLCLVGLILLFISLFFDWYSFSYENSSGQIFVSWVYNPLFEWSSDLAISGSNLELMPNNLNIPILISIIFIGSLIFTGYVILYKDPEKERKLQSLTYYAYGNFLTLVLSSFYIISFPAVYLLQEGLFYPYILYEDYQTGITISYLFGPGYYIQVLGFVLSFPYIVFYLRIIEKFQNKDNDVSVVIDKYINNQ